MPCYKCSNGKWKYGKEGNCQFDTLESCKAAERAIHAREGEKSKDRDRDNDDKPKKKPKK